VHGHQIQIVPGKQMIARLTGKLTECSPDRIVLDVSGVGYDIIIPLSTYYKLTTPQATTSLQIHTHVREDALQLYGFVSSEERMTFVRLIGISGIGPKVALALLSGIGVAEFWDSIARGDRERLQQIPGIGKKTAERVLLELRDAEKRYRNAKDESKNTSGAGGSPTDGLGRERADCISALTNLGYTTERARSTIDRTLEELDDGATVEIILKAALGGLIR
jgi:Holliday junction DNA helicase RuvA